MLPRSICAVALTTLLPACDGDRVLREPVTVERHGVTVTASNAEKGKLRIALHNGRDERISRPQKHMWLHMIDGIPTISIGPNELYFQGCESTLVGVEAPGIDPGGSWEMESALPDDEDFAPEEVSDPSARAISGRHRQDARTRLEKARLRVWIFPHIGIANQSQGRAYQVLPLIFVVPPKSQLSPAAAVFDTSRDYSPTAERDVFRAQRLGPAGESRLYFVETEIDLKRPLEANLITEESRSRRKRKSGVRPVDAERWEAEEDAVIGEENKLRKDLGVPQRGGGPELPRGEESARPVVGPKNLRPGGY